MASWRWKLWEAMGLELCLHIILDVRFEASVGWPSRHGAHGSKFWRVAFVMNRCRGMVPCVELRGAPVDPPGMVRSDTVCRCVLLTIAVDLDKYRYSTRHGYTRSIVKQQ